MRLRIVWLTLRAEFGELGVGVRTLDQEAHLADPGVPARAGEQVRLHTELLRLIPVQPDHAAGDAGALEVERLARAHVDQAGKPGLEQVGARRLEHVDPRDAVRREVLKLDVAALGGENFTAVIGGGQIGQAAQRDALCDAGVAGDLDAGDARERFGRGHVGQLADILGDDRIDDLVGILLDRLRGLEALADRRDDDVLLARATLGGDRLGARRVLCQSAHRCDHQRQRRRGYEQRTEIAIGHTALPHLLL